MNIIKKLYTTEKSSSLLDANNVFTFICGCSVNKIELKKYIEKKYKVTVKKITSLVYKPKPKKQRYKGFTKKYKKVYVTVKEGQKIEVE